MFYRIRCAFEYRLRKLTLQYNLPDQNIKSVLSILITVAILFASVPGTATAQNFSCASVSEIPQIECEALLALYNGTDGSNWTNNTNWLITNTPSNWLGVTVTDGRVTGINLFGVESYNLTGAIPPELGNLTSLKKLYLINNKLSGTIPPQIGNLVQLEQLGLASNQLTGAIPPEIGQLTALKSLYLHFNQLSGSIPAQLGNLAPLGEMHLYNNRLTGTIPPQLGGLSNLRILRLQNNQLSGDVPAALGNLRVYAPGAYYYGLDLDYNFLNVPDGYPVAGNDFHRWLSEADLEWHTRQAVEQVLEESGGTVEALDGKTVLDIPQDTLPDQTTIAFIPQPEPLHATGSLQLAQNSFQIFAADGAGSPITSFTKPIVLTVAYSDEDIAGIPEFSLRLYYFDEAEGEWLDVVTTCPGGEYTRNLAANTLSAPLCHLSDFTLASDSASYTAVYLPVATR